MKQVLISYIWPIGLFAAAVLCFLFSKRSPRGKVLLSILTALFSEMGLIASFIMGATIQELMIPFLILLLLNLHSHERMEGGEH